jgi:cytochrome b561
LDEIHLKCWSYIIIFKIMFLVFIVGILTNHYINISIFFFLINIVIKLTTNQRWLKILAKEIRGD